MTRPRISFAWLHACCGCEVSLLDAGDGFLQLLQAVEIVHFPLLMDHKDQIDAQGRLHLPEAEIGVVSGAVASEEDFALLAAMRASCRTLVALGTCATHGGIPAMRNQWTTQETLQTVYAYGSDEQSLIPAAVKKSLDRVYSADEQVKVDCLVPGCPPAAEAIVAVLLALMAGESVATTAKSVCETCPTRRGAKGAGTMRRFLDNASADPESGVEAMSCLLEQGLLCMGPATAGGCGGQDTPLCLRAHAPCRGCYGPVRAGGNPLLDMMNALASNGIDHRSLVDRKSLLRFCGSHGLLKPLRKRL